MTTITKSLTCQDVKAVQETLGQFIEHPWHDYDRITALPPNGLEILEQTLRETKALGDFARPDLAASRQQSIDSLKTLCWSLDRAQPDPEIGYPLNTAQVCLYGQAWQGLEAIRRELAVTMLDVMKPFIGVISDERLQSTDLKPGKTSALDPCRTVQEKIRQLESEAVC